MRKTITRLTLVAATFASATLLSTATASADSSYWAHIRDYWSSNSSSACAAQGSADVHNPSNAAFDWQCAYIGTRETPQHQFQDGYALWERFPA